MTDTAGWITLLSLGAFHGINPAMGWLFAAALGLQEQDRRAVWRALLPLAAGHAAAVLVAVAVAAALTYVMPVHYLRWLVAAVLLGFGARRLFRHGHPRFGGMRVRLVDLALWSFLMASAHGAGLMVVPLVLRDTPSAPAMTQTPHDVQEPAAAVAAPLSEEGMTTKAGVEMAGMSHDHPMGVAAAAVHTAGYLAVTALLAVLFFEWLGVGLLKKLWVNLDLVWAVALMATAVLTPLL